VGENSKVEAVQNNFGGVLSYASLIADIRNKVPTGLTDEETESLFSSLSAIDGELIKEQPQEKNKGILQLAPKSLMAIKGTTEFGAAVTALVQFVQNL